MTPAERSRAAWARDRALAEAAAQRAARQSLELDAARADRDEPAEESAAPVSTVLNGAPFYTAHH